MFYSTLTWKKQLLGAFFLLPAETSSNLIISSDKKVEISFQKFTLPPKHVGELQALYYKHNFIILK